MKYPKRKIWIWKEDFKLAFIRLHLNSITAFRSAVRVTIIGTYYILISLRQPFGGAPFPSVFAVINDLITDTINDLLECEEWDHETNYSDLANKIPREKYLDDDIPFHAARESVKFTITEYRKTDVYVDDIITVSVDSRKNLRRITRAPITIIHAIADISLANHTTVRRNDIVAEDKMEAEGAAKEEKICLGWLLNTRTLSVKLPKHKAIAWTSQIKDTLQNTTVSNKNLQSILG